MATPCSAGGKGSGHFFYSSLLRPLCIVQDQSQHTILSHECCYHNFNRKFQGVNQLGNHKQLHCQSSLINYAALERGNVSKGIPMQQAAAAKVTRPLPSLAERDVVTQDYVPASS